MSSMQHPPQAQGDSSDKSLREQQLEALIKKYKILSDASVDAIAITENGIIRYINSAFTRTFGYDRKELKGSSIYQMITAASADILDDALHGDHYEIFPSIGKRKDSTSFTAEIHVKPCEGLPYMAVTIRDISMRKALERQLNRKESEYRQLFEDTKDAIYISSKEGKFLDANKALLDMFKYSKEEILEMEILKLYAHPEDREKFITRIETVGSINDFEVQLVKKDGHVIDCLLSSSVKRDHNGMINGYQGIIRDITDLKKTAELQRLKELAENSAEMKSRFLANMSHEIRTPLNAIFGIANLLEDTPLSEQQSHYLDVIQSSTDHLLVLINDILDFSKIEAGKLTLETVEFSMEDLIDDLEHTVRFKVNARGLQFDVKKSPHIPPYLRGDYVRLKQILLNLLSNAIKFTEEGSVTLHIRLLEEKGAYVHLFFSVSDTGIGIPTDKQAVIFDSFTQAADSTTRLFGGTGLGLAITKKLIEMQGGTISLTSEEGKGSTFSFTLRFATASGEEYMKRKATEHFEDLRDLGDLRILIVEDNKVNQFVTKETIGKWGTGMQIDVADNGQQSLDKLMANRYDIIIMDVQMPIMDGHTAAKAIRTTFPADKKDIPILAMTAFATPGEAEKCLASGMDDYIPKPFNPRNLYNKIAELTGRTDGIPLSPLPHEKIVPPPDVPIVEEEEPILNLQYLDSLSQGDQELKHKMLQVLVDESPDDLKRLRAYLQSGDYDRFAGAAHKFKSSATFVGNKRLEKLLKTMELNARGREHLDKLPDQLTDVENTFEQAILLIKEILLREGGQK